jgi:hypothetical protein
MSWRKICIRQAASNKCMMLCRETYCTYYNQNYDWPWFMSEGGERNAEQVGQIFDQLKYILYREESLWLCTLWISIAINDSFALLVVLTTSSSADVCLRMPNCHLGRLERSRMYSLRCVWFSEGGGIGMTRRLWICTLCLPLQGQKQWQFWRQAVEVSMEFIHLRDESQHLSFPLHGEMLTCMCLPLYQL